MGIVREMYIARKMGATQPPLGTAAATPTKQTQTITPGQGEYGLSQVTVNPIPAQYVDTADATATAADVGSGKTAYIGGNKVTGTGDILMISPDILESYAVEKSGACGAVAYAGLATTALGNLDLKVYFTGWQNGYTATCVDSEGTSWPVTYQTSGNYEMVIISGIDPTVFPEKFTITVTNGTNSYVAVCSVFSYVRSTLANSSSTAAKKEFAAAMYWYGVKAKALFG